jgi:hypothetical protein
VTGQIFEVGNQMIEFRLVDAPQSAWRFIVYGILEFAVARMGEDRIAKGQILSRLRAPPANGPKRNIAPMALVDMRRDRRGLARVVPSDGRPLLRRQMGPQRIVKVVPAGKRSIPRIVICSDERLGCMDRRRADDGADRC